MKFLIYFDDDKNGFIYTKYIKFIFHLLNIK